MLVYSHFLCILWLLINLPSYPLLNDLPSPHISFSTCITEDVINLLQRATPRLLNEYPSPKEGECSKDGEEDIGPEPGILYHGRCDPANDEVHEPVGAGSCGCVSTASSSIRENWLTDSNALRSQTAREHLGRHRPRHGTPGCAEADHIEEKEADCDPSGSCVSRPVVPV